MYKILRDNIVIPDLEDLDLFQYLSLIPNLVIYYSDVLLRYYPSEKSLQNCLQYLESDQYFEDLVDENLIVQRYRLQALYYRRQANLAAADQAWIRYIQAFKPAKQENYTLEKLSHVSAYPSSQVLSNMAQIYSQINETNTEVLLLSGNSNETCFHYQCTDCCTKDFPTLSLVEYLHIINNAPRELLEIFSKRAKMIQEEYKQRYNSSLEIIDQTVHPRGFENPQNFRFRCPFLGDDNLCQVYEWRPLICRAFGLAAHSEESIQSCGYFLTQYHYSSSNRYEMPVLDLAPIVALLGGANKYQAKSSPRYSNMKQPVGTAVAWLLEEIQ